MEVEELKELETRLKKMQKAFLKKADWAKGSKDPDEAYAFKDFVETRQSSLAIWLSRKGMGKNFQEVAENNETLSDLYSKLIPIQQRLDSEKMKKAKKKLPKSSPKSVMKKGKEELQKDYAKRGKGTKYVKMGEWAYASKDKPGLYTDSLQPCVGVAIFNEKTGAMALAHLAEDQNPAEIMEAMMDKVGIGGKCHAAIVTGEPLIRVKGIKGKTLNPLYSRTMDKVTEYIEKGTFRWAADLTDEKLGTAALQILPTGEISRFRKL
jgi:hypothetical protein